MQEQEVITIRNVQLGDLKQVADIMAYSFRAKLNRILPLPQKHVSDFLIDVGLVYPCPFPGYIVAELKGEVVAVMVLKWLYQDRPKMKLKLSKAARYGWLTAFKLLISVHILQENLREGECHIEEIAVKPEARYRGIGTRLLDFGRELAMQNGLKEYTLHVASSNKAALKLYKKAGFRLLKSQRSVISRWLFSVKEWHYMVQDITHPIESETGYI